MNKNSCNSWVWHINLWYIASARDRMGSGCVPCVLCQTCSLLFSVLVLSPSITEESSTGPEQAKEGTEEGPSTGSTHWEYHVINNPPWTQAAFVSLWKMKILRFHIPSSVHDSYSNEVCFVMLDSAKSDLSSEMFFKSASQVRQSDTVLTLDTWRKWVIMWS